MRSHVDTLGTAVINVLLKWVRVIPEKVAHILRLPHICDIRGQHYWGSCSSCPSCTLVVTKHALSRPRISFNADDWSPAAPGQEAFHAGSLHCCAADSLCTGGALDVVPLHPDTHCETAAGNTAVSSCRDGVYCVDHPPVDVHIIPGRLPWAQSCEPHTLLQNQSALLQGSGPEQYESC